MKKLHTVWLVVLLIGLALSPFGYWLPASIPFEVPKVWAVLVWIELCLMLGTPLFQARSRLSLQLVGLLLMLLGVMTFASLFGQDIVHSFFGNYYRMDGLLTYVHLGLLAILVGWWVKLRDWRLVWMVVAGTSLTLSLLTVIAYMGKVSILGTGFWDGAVGLMFGNPNFLAGYLVVTYPTVVYVAHLLSQKSSMNFWRLLVYLPLVAVVFTASRASLLVLGLFWVLIWMKSMSKKSVHIVGMALIGVLILLAGLWLKHDSNDPSLVFAPESRERIVRKMLDGLRYRPILGYGWAQASKAFDAGVWPYVVRFDVHVDKAHSTLLEYLVTTGLVGFVAYVAFIVLVMWRIRQKSLQSGEMVMWWMVFLYVLYAQTNVLSISTEVVFSVLVGYALQAD